MLIHINSMNTIENYEEIIKRIKSEYSDCNLIIVTEQLTDNNRFNIWVASCDTEIIKKTGYCDSIYQFFNNNALHFNEYEVLDLDTSAEFSYMLNRI